MARGPDRHQWWEKEHRACCPRHWLAGRAPPRDVPSNACPPPSDYGHPVNGGGGATNRPFHGQLPVGWEDGEGSVVAGWKRHRQWSRGWKESLSPDAAGLQTRSCCWCATRPPPRCAMGLLPPVCVGWGGVVAAVDGLRVGARSTMKIEATTGGGACACD
jgi:hypothetical protein